MFIASIMFLKLVFLFALLLETINSETFCPTVSGQTDKRSDKSKLRIVQYNVEWLFVDYYAASDCPGNGCSWKNESEARIHIDYVSKIINELQPDIMNLCEVEGCDELTMLSANTYYSPYNIKGKDTSTGQNVGILTRIDPMVNLYRTEERVQYPIPNSHCGYTGESNDTGVSKHYITEYNVNGLQFAMIGVHFIAFPTDPERCAQREAQAQIIQNVIAEYISKNMEVVLLGDFNDFDAEVLDANNNKPISMVLDIVKGKGGNKKGTYELFNIAEKITQKKRYTDWWDKNNDCKSVSTEFSMIDHILVTPIIRDKIVNQFIYTGYSEYCGTYNSDHYPIVIDLLL
jgi:exonuclease III